MRKIFLFFTMFVCTGVYAQTVNPKTVINKKHLLDTGQTLEIPVAFHIVDDNPASFNLSKKRLKHFLGEINELMNKVHINYIDPYYRKNIGIPNIKLVPVKNGSRGQNISFVSKHVVSKQSFYFDAKNPFATGINAYGYIDAHKVLNIWVADLGEKIGYGMKPYSKYAHGQYDGMLISKKILEQRGTYPCFIHELGHYFGLEHIWGDTNKKGDSHCNKDDFVNDTPNQPGPNIRYGSKKESAMDDDSNGDNNKFEFSEIQKLCNDPTTASNYQNFMDYAYEFHSMFTKGQVLRMRYMILEYRPDLLKTNKQLAKANRKRIWRKINNTMTEIGRYALEQERQKSYSPQTGPIQTNTMPLSTAGPIRTSTKPITTSTYVPTSGRSASGDIITTYPKEYYEVQKDSVQIAPF